MCSPIHPRPGAQYFSFLHTKHFCKAPTSRPHEKLILRYLLTPAQRCRGSNCSRLSALVQGPTVAVSYK